MLSTNKTRSFPRRSARVAPLPRARRARAALLLGAVGAGLLACLQAVPASWASPPAPASGPTPAVGKGGGGGAGGCSSFAGLAAASPARKSR
jgi:hypothetical protein